jgi:hypothetical protein
MLQIQRWKNYSNRELRSQGLSQQEIHDIRSSRPGAFRPAFVNGQRRQERPQNGEMSFYERYQQLQQKPQPAGPSLS